MRTQKNNQKTVTTKEREQFINMARWLVLLVATGAAIYCSAYLMIGILFLVIPETWGTLLSYFIAFIPVALISFFTAKIIAPTHKNLFGWIAVLLNIVWSAFVLYGLAHLAY